MNNEELKKKIRKTILDTNYNYPDDAQHYNHWLFHVADALIAAGIGDVSELKKQRVVVECSHIPEDGNSYILPNTPLKIKQLYSGEEVEQIVKERDILKYTLKEAEHRAEVAERALFLSAKEIEYLNGNFDSSAEFFAKEKVIPFFIRQAEKELAEEGKDE